MSSLVQTVQTENSAALPLGRRSPRGKLRWYLVACPEKQEAATCERVRRIIPQQLLEDAFVPRKERVNKVHGEFVTEVVRMFEGYFVVATKDAPALSRALAKLSFPAHMVGAVGRGWQPVAEDAQAFLEQCMDATHTIRTSQAEIVSDRLHVLWGPLKGCEGRVSRYIRRKATAIVQVSEGQEGFTLSMPMAIPVRR